MFNHQDHPSLPSSLPPFNTQLPSHSPTVLAHHRALQARIRELRYEAHRCASHARRLEIEITTAAAHGLNLEDQLRVVNERVTHLTASQHHTRHRFNRVFNATQSAITRLQQLQDSATWSIAQPLFLLERRWPLFPRLLAQFGRFIAWSLRLQLRQQLTDRRRARALLAHGVFDAHWYARTYPDVLTWNAPLVLHWLKIGWQQGRQPHPLFDVQWYLMQQPSLEQQLKTARFPHATDPLTHYLLFGERAGYSPHPLFDPQWYLMQNSDVAALQNVNAWQHYVHIGECEGRDPHPLFSTAWYLKQLSPNDATGIQHPLQHYLMIGAQSGLSPHPLFDTAWYWQHYPDIAASGIDPLQHYLRDGAHEGRDPNPLFDSDWYVAQAQLAIDINPLRHYLEYGAAAGDAPHPLFDSTWYLANNPDVRGSGQNPLAHYLHHGAYEERDPSPQFNTAGYLRHYPHVRDQHLNPLVHFIIHHGGRNPEQWGGSYPTIASTHPNSPDTALAAVLGQSHPLAYLHQFYPSARFANDPSAFQPSITVIVPNFNHASYLRQRLDSIYNQTYPIAEIVLLDDASTDDSRAILMEYASRDAARTRIVFNSEPSGGAFRQWQRGIELATSELIWIAESDDWCQPDFLAKLVPFFMDEAVQLAYSKSQFIDENNCPTAFCCEDYLAELSPIRWSLPYVETAHREVCEYLGRKNTIPNVSAVVFRKPDLRQLLKTAWRDLRICGDWLFYLYVLRGGKLAYTSATTNYYRLHSSNSSAATYRTPNYYQEHALIASEIARLYAVPDDTLTAHRQYVARFYRDNANELEGQGMSFPLLYNQTQIMAAAQQRRPTVLMAIFGFATGGGEVFPIRLANELQYANYTVTVFNFAGEPFNTAVRQLLNPTIPVIERNAWFPSVAWLIDAFGIDVVHSHHASVDQVVALAKAETVQAFRHVVTMHGMYEGMAPWLFQLMLEQIGDQVDTWVTIADKNLTPFIAAGAYQPERFIRIPNGMSFAPFTPIERATLGLNDSAFVVCLASRAIAEKGWRAAIAIVTRARELSGRDIQLLLLGDGVIYDELRTESVPPYVQLLGFVAQPVAYFALADVGLLPSTFKGESFPLTLIECLVAGRPFIASDLGEVRQMLTSDNGNLAGCLIDVSNGVVPIETTAEQVALLATNNELYARQAELARQIAPRFDLTTIMQQYAAVYELSPNFCATVQT
ncbi:glycosyltransferase [Thiospirillum jenense]|uniref:Glycosyltransferase n=1 Tax=Thiospirillum jenense TaxID=1653858 RepID=A0A839HFJ0_9GAMM|nr:glycosyltransferase [Thiospirillum jenense]MBB1126126.1 glycosyltransferase [Thiospirillum jenense]